MPIVASSFAYSAACSATRGVALTKEWLAAGAGAAMRAAPLAFFLDPAHHADRQTIRDVARITRVPLRSLGQAVRCALVTARHLGPLATPLEALLCAELRSEAWCLRAEAASALGALGSVSDETAGALAALLDDVTESAVEAAVALVRLGLEDHAAVLAAAGASPRAWSKMASARKRRVKR